MRSHDLVTIADCVARPSRVTPSLSQPGRRALEPVDRTPTDHGQVSASDGGLVFANALRAAIEDSGLALDRIHHRLKERGVELSSATLSYWQSGRSAPSRRGSIAALVELEGVLGVERGSLASLVPERLRTDPRRVGPLFTSAPQIKPGMATSELLAAFHAARRQFERVSHHWVLTFGADRRQQSGWSRSIVRPLSDGLDRILLLDYSEDTSVPLPRINPRSHCALGARHEFDVQTWPWRFAITELVFDHALQKGDAVIFEFETVYGPPYPLETSAEYSSATAMRELAIELRFHPDAAPRRCELHEYELPGPHPMGPARPIELDASRSVVVVRHDLPPSQLVLRWSWD
jgi:hypothetical protein